MCYNWLENTIENTYYLMSPGVGKVGILFSQQDSSPEIFFLNHVSKCGQTRKYFFLGHVFRSWESQEMFFPAIFPKVGKLEKKFFLGMFSTKMFLNYLAKCYISWKANFAFATDNKDNLRANSLNLHLLLVKSQVFHLNWH